LESTNIDLFLLNYSNKTTVIEPFKGIFGYFIKKYLMFTNTSALRQETGDGTSTPTSNNSRFFNILTPVFLVLPVKDYSKRE
jgi:lantibiotic modifying enzyme